MGVFVIDGNGVSGYKKTFVGAKIGEHRMNYPHLDTTNREYQ